MHATDFPPFCTQPATDISLAYSRQGLILVYEKERDFLSTPKTYIVISAQFLDDTLLSIGSSNMSDEQWQTLLELPFGIYQFTNPNDEDTHIFYTEDQLIELTTASLTQVTEIYQQPSTSEALIKFLGDQ